MSVLVFDIETIPDLMLLRKQHKLLAQTDEEVLQAAQQLRQGNGQSSFHPHYQHQVVAIAVAYANEEGFKLWSLGGPEEGEAKIIQRFFHIIEQRKPQLVSWNGSGFDLPVLHYRALYHGIAAPAYFDQGEVDPQFKWNNYLNRYHMRHLDLMDFLAGFQARAYAPLDGIAQSLGLPGKQGMDGSDVAAAYWDGRLAEIRQYCESDVLNTYGVFLRTQCMRGHLTPKTYVDALERVKTHLAQKNDPFWDSFQQWVAEEVARSIPLSTQ
ncbi:MAG: 3'-5' exonuclease [Pseudomonadota bacterium]